MTQEEKAKEAPEKIYVQLPSRNWIGRTWNETPIKEGDNPNWKNATNIEYTRTDVFIERVCDWLSDNLQTVVDVNYPAAHHVESIPVLGSITQTEFLKKFRKEIKYLFD